MATVAHSRRDARKEKAKKEAKKQNSQDAQASSSSQQQVQSPVESNHNDTLVAGEDDSVYNVIQFENEQEKRSYRELLIRLAKEVNCKLRVKPSGTQSLDDDWFQTIAEHIESNTRKGNSANTNDLVTLETIQQIITQATTYTRGLSLNRMCLLLAVLACSQVNEAKLTEADVLTFAMNVLPMSDKLTRRNLFMLLANLTIGPKSQSKVAINRKATMNKILSSLNHRELLAPLEAPSNPTVDLEREKRMLEALQVNIINLLANVLSGEQYEATGNMLIAESPKTTDRTAPAAPNVSVICQFFANCLHSDSYYVRFRAVAFLTLFTRVEKARAQLNNVQLLQQIINMVFGDSAAVNLDEDDDASASASAATGKSKAASKKAKKASSGNTSEQQGLKDLIAEYSYSCIAHMCMDETNAAYVCTERKDVLVQLAAVVKKTSKKSKEKRDHTRLAAYNAISVALHGAQPNTVYDIVVGCGLTNTLVEDLSGEDPMRHPAIITLNSIATNAQEGVVDIFRPLLENKVLDKLAALSMDPAEHIVGSAVAAIRSLLLKVTEAEDEGIKQLVTEAVQRSEHLKQIVMYLEEYEKSKGTAKPAPVKQILLSVAALVLFLIAAPYLYRLARMVIG